MSVLDENIASAKVMMENRFSSIRLLNLVLCITILVTGFFARPYKLFAVQNDGIQVDESEFADYLAQLNLEQLAAMRQWHVMTKVTEDVEKFRAAYQVARWIDRQLEHQDVQQFLEDSGWGRRLESSIAEAAIPALMVQKYRFGQLSNEAMKRIFQDEESNQSLMRSFSEVSRKCRAIEQELNNFDDRLKVNSAALEVAQNHELLHVTQSTIGWCSYYRWLLSVDHGSNEELLAAKTGLMNLLGISAPDLDSGATFRWYDGNDSLQRRSLLGLGLVLTALGDFTQANTCMATLQEHATESLRSEFFFYQWISVIRSRRWNDARRLEESYFRDLQLEQAPVAGRLLNSMLSALTGVQPGRSMQLKTLGSDFTLSNSEVQLCVQSLLNRLVTIGWVKSASDWEAATRSLEKGTLEFQLIQLQNTIDQLGFSGQSNEQLSPLVEKLRELSQHKKPGIRQWALEQLTEVFTAQELNTPLQEVLEKRWDLAWQPEQRQELAWRVAELLATIEGRSAEAINWYRKSIEANDGSELAEMSRLKIDLLEARFNSIQRIQILQSAAKESGIAEFASNRLVTELYETWLLERSDSGKDKWSRQLEPLLEDLLESDSQLNAKQLSAMVMMINLLESRLANRSVEDAERKSTEERVRRIFDNLFQRLSTEPSGKIWFQDSMVISILAKALPYWDQTEETDKIVKVGNLVQFDRLSPEKQFLFLNYVTRAEERRSLAGEAVDSKQVLSRIKRMVALIESAKLQIPDSLKWSVRSRLLKWVLQEESLENALEYTEQFGEPSQWSPVYHPVLGRILMKAGQLEQANRIWRRISRESLDGTAGWFEAQYYLIKITAVDDQAEAKLQYEKLTRLYPQIGQPWQNRLDELAAENNWN